MSGLGADGRRAAFRRLAAELERQDLAPYAEAGRDPRDPILGEGDPACRVCIFGRDPGRHEVLHGMPFIGAGGQKVRKALHRHLHGGEMPDFEASVAVGRHVFWANTVPYKPLGNKVWPARVRHGMRPIVCDLLVHGWQGDHVLALGRVAFDWFGHDKETKARLKAHWGREDRFQAHLDVTVRAPDGTTKTVHLHPVPHPSPLNATWAPHVPRLLAERFVATGITATDWRV